MCYIMTSWLASWLDEMSVARRLCISAKWQACGASRTTWRRYGVVMLLLCRCYMCVNRMFRCAGWVGEVPVARKLSTSAKW
jgi:hypothetical protein